MRMLANLLLALALGVAQSAQAEGGCPPGQIPYSGTSVSSCGPMQGQQLGPAWSNRWGAIASDTKGIFGISADASSKRKAQSTALSECKKRGGIACKVGTTYANQCAAVSTSEDASSSARAPTVEEAAKISMEGCTERSGGKECWVYYSGCSLPVRVR